MPISYRAKINLQDSDPQFLFRVNQGPEPEDDYLHYRLGQEYGHYRKLRRDSHITAKLSKRIQAILGRRLIVEHPEFEDLLEEKSTESIMFARRLLSLVNYEDITRQLLDDGLLLGFAALKVDWELDPITEIRFPTFEVIPQHRINFSFHTKDPNVPLVTGERISRQAPVKDQIAMSGSYEIRLLTKKAPLVGERIPKGRVLLFTYGSSQGRPWGRGLAYQCYPLFKIKTEARSAWLLHSDRLGSPPIIGHYPFNNKPIKDEDSANIFDMKNPAHKAIKDDFDDFLAAISPNGYGSYPEGFEAKLLENIHTASPDVHERLWKICDYAISEAILGEVGFSERVSTGSQAANKSQAEDRDRNLTDSDCSCIDSQLKDFWKYYWGLNAPNDLVCPHVRRWTTEDERKEQQEAIAQERRKLAAEADKTLVEAGFVPNEEYVKETYGEHWTFVGVLAPAAPEPTTEKPEEPEKEIEDTDPVVEQREWTGVQRRKLANGDFKGGFAGDLKSFPIACSKDLDRIFSESEFSDQKDIIRFNAINACRRFGFQLSEKASEWASSHLIGDFASASRFATWNGYKIGIEYEVGSKRFERPMKIAYGYFVNHIGADNEALDVYLGPHFSATSIYKIKQLDQNGNFDEYKYGIFFESAEQFEKAYKRQVPSRFFGGIEKVSKKDIDKTKKMDKKSKGFGQYTRDHSEPVKFEKGIILKDTELDQIATDREQAEEDAVKEWETNAPEGYERLLE